MSMGIRVQPDDTIPARVATPPSLGGCSPELTRERADVIFEK